MKIALLMHEIASSEENHSGSFDFIMENTKTAQFHEEKNAK